MYCVKVFIPSYNKYVTKVLIFKFVVILITTPLVYYLASRLHLKSYLWQSTVLADYFRPVNRKSCFLPPTLSEPLEGRIKIGILSVYKDEDGGWDSNLMNRVIKNREAYAKKWGYVHLNGNDMIENSRPGKFLIRLIYMNIDQARFSLSGVVKITCRGSKAIQGYNNFIDHF